MLVDAQPHMDTSKHIYGNQESRTGLIKMAPLFHLQVTLQRTQLLTQQCGLLVSVAEKLAGKCSMYLNTSNYLKKIVVSVAIIL